ncbi:hypothetical protein [Pseudomonas aeruginosa]
MAVNLSQSAFSRSIRRSNTALAAAWWTARPRTCVRPSRA